MLFIQTAGCSTGMKNPNSLVMGGRKGGVQEGEVWGRFARGGWASLELGLWSAKDAFSLLHFRATVAGVVHLQTIIEFIQVFFHLSDLLPGHVFQPKAHLRVKNALNLK